MQQMIDKLRFRGYTTTEATELIATFRKSIEKTGHDRTLEESIDQLIVVLDEYKRIHGEYVKLVMP
jgi:hypothetical protein